jgi:hypothetical protein
LQLLPLRADSIAPVLLAQSTTSPVPNQTLVTANPNGIGTINLAATADGNTAGGSGADSGNAFGTNGGAGGHGFVLIAW